MAYSMMKQYTISDGKTVLTLQEAQEGGYVVISPLDPQLITEAGTVKEAFGNARDALAALSASRRRLIKRLAGVRVGTEGRSKGTLVRTAVSSTTTELGNPLRFNRILCGIFQPFNGSTGLPPVVRI
jgi:predicted RNase H-like HicB family nuclease